MSDSPNSVELCRYEYDPLDRQCGCTVVQQPALQRFLCKDRLATEIQGTTRWSIFQHDDQLLAQQHRPGADATTALLATNQPRSVISVLESNRLNPIAYSAYGHRSGPGGLLGLLGFNGERPDPITGHYHLGNGYRQFNPVLMRFNSPDSLSPFGEGGINAYGYCEGDPTNKIDRSGHNAKFWINLEKWFDPEKLFGSSYLIPRAKLSKPFASGSRPTNFSSARNASGSTSKTISSARPHPSTSEVVYTEIDHFTPTRQHSTQWQQHGFNNKKSYLEWQKKLPTMTTKGAIKEQPMPKPVAPQVEQSSAKEIMLKIKREKAVRISKFTDDGREIEKIDNKILALRTKNVRFQ